MEGWMLWSNLSRLVNGAPVERDLGCLYESNLFEGVIEDFQLLHCQVPVDLYYYPLDAYACARSSVQDLSICSRIEGLGDARYVLIVTCRSVRVCLELGAG